MVRAGGHDDASSLHVLPADEPFLGHAADLYVGWWMKCLHMSTCRCSRVVGIGIGLPTNCVPVHFTSLEIMSVCVRFSKDYDEPKKPNKHAYTRLHTQTLPWPPARR